MKLSKDNVYLNKIFVPDPIGNNVPAYDSDEDIHRVIVDAGPQIRVMTKDSITYVPPLNWNSEEQFNYFALQSLLTGCAHTSSIVSSIAQAWLLFKKRDLLISRALVSHNFTKNDAKQFYDCGISHIGWHNNFIHKVDGLAPNDIMLVPDPEFLGVLPIKDGLDGELYGIGVINTNAAVLIRQRSLLG